MITQRVAVCSRRISLHPPSSRHKQPVAMPVNDSRSITPQSLHFGCTVPAAARRQARYFCGTLNKLLLGGRGVHHDILVTAFEFHGDCKRISHETFVQPVKPVLVPESKVGAKFQAPREAGMASTSSNHLLMIILRLF